MSLRISDTLVVSQVHSRVIRDSRFHRDGDAEEDERIAASSTWEYRAMPLSDPEVPSIMAGR
jgi:hypothetical protein